MEEEKQKYFNFDWDNEIIHDFIKDKSELSQILHCATVFNVDYWMLVIGDNLGNVIAGVPAAATQTYAITVASGTLYLVGGTGNVFYLDASL